MTWCGLKSTLPFAIATILGFCHPYFPSTAWAAASRAIGTRKGEQLT